MLDIDIINETQTDLPAEYEKAITSAVRACAEAGDASKRVKAEVCVLVTTNESIRELNLAYRNIDAETDVLSFPQHGPGEAPPNYGNGELHDDGAPFAYGDIVISLEKALSQAKDYGHSPERELGFLAAHGMLHLMGFDHMSPEDEKIMVGRQEEVLQKAGLTRGTP